MKKILLLFILLGLGKLSSAQTPNWLWAVHSGGGSFQYPNGLWVDPTDTLFIAGRLSGTIAFNGGASASGTGADNPFVGKLDSTGKSVWLKSISYSGGYDYGWGFCIDKNSNVYTGGTVSSGSSMFIMKYDRQGNQKWSITPSGGGVAAMGLITDGANNLYVTGSMQGNVTFGSTTLIYTGSGQNVFLAKLDTNGNFIWAVNSGVVSSSGGFDVGRSITIDEFANVYVGGGYSGQPSFGSFIAPASGGTSNLFIAEYDSTGKAINLITALNAGFDNGDCCSLNHITLDSCRNIYLTGYYRGTATFGNFNVSSQGGEDIYVAQANNSGVWQWANDIGSSGDDQPGGITFDKNSDVYVGGYYANPPATFNDAAGTTTTINTGRFFVAKYANSNGALQWVQTAGTASNGGGVGGVAVDNQKYVYVTMNPGNVLTSFGPNIAIQPSSNSDIFVAKLDTVASRYIIPQINSSYCPGAKVPLSYTLIGTFNSGNVFTAQLSDSTGSFANPTFLGDTTANTNGYITITIPTNLPPGNYLIRIISSNPAGSSYVNGCGAYYQQNVYPNTSYITIGGGKSQVLITASKDTTCNGVPVTLTASKGDSYLWNTSDTSRAITVNLIKDSTFTVTVNSGGCTGDTSITIKVDSSAKLDIEPQSPTICFGSSVTLFVKGGGANFVWTPGTGLSDTTGSSIIATPTGNITYTVTGNDSVGCVATGSNDVSVVPAPNKPTISASTDGDTLISSATQGNQWYFNDTLIVGATNQKLDITGKNKGWYTVTVINPANGCSATSDSTTGVNLLSSINEQLSIYPNPTTGSILITISSSVQDVGDWSLEVSDVLGQIVVTRPSLNHTTKIDLREFANGVYFIAVANKTGQAVFPVVKQN